jgi:hypothetical protein
MEFASRRPVYAPLDEDSPMPTLAPTTFLRSFRFLGILAVCPFLLGTAALRSAELPKPVLPDGLGVNIHFTDPQPGEMEMMAQAGFRFIRMDFAWGGIEREKGQYDFSAYDRLMKALDAHHVRAVFILDYSNPHYDKGLSPASDEGRKAFARWAAAAQRHFRGRGILWEMYNEPNIGFWKPKPDVEQYAKLALEVGKALREAASDEIYIGPATSGIDMPFLEGCFKAGLLEYWSAVSVHPYRQNAPETATEEYAKLRRLIAHYAPKGKTIPILSGEWGYSSVWNAFDEVKQGKHLPRQWMTNLANEVPLSIWYDWHDDGVDPKEPEHHFGTVKFPYFKGRDPVYDPKPAYLAAKTLTAKLAGFQFSKRLAVGSRDDYVFLFSKGNEVRLAAWTTAEKPHAIVIPASPGRFAATSHTGQTLPVLTADAQGLAVTVTDAPQYLIPESANELLQIGAAWQRVPGEFRHKAQPLVALNLTLRNPLTRSIRVASESGPAVDVKSGETTVLSSVFDVSRSPKPRETRLECRVDEVGCLAQSMSVVATNPLVVSVGPPIERNVIVQVQNPSGEAFQGKIRLTDVEGLRTAAPVAPLEFSSGQREKTVAFPLPLLRTENRYRLGVRVEDEAGRVQGGIPPATRMIVDRPAHYLSQPIEAAWGVFPDGDAKVASTQTVATTPLPPGLWKAESDADAISLKVDALKIHYSFGEGWKFIRLAPKTEALRKIEGCPKAMGIWVYGNGSGHALCLRVADKAGQTFQSASEPMTWKGWRYVEISLDPATMSHWGGPNDGVVHYPIHWDTVLIIDGNRHACTPPEVYVSFPVLVY